MLFLSSVMNLQLWFSSTDKSYLWPKEASKVIKFSQIKRIKAFFDIFRIDKYLNHLTSDVFLF